MTIRVLIADDQALIRVGLRSLIESDTDFEVAGEATNGLEAIAMARSHRADIVLMDIRMPEHHGIEATRQITSDEDLDGIRILILTTFELDENVFRALRAGASGFIGKGFTPHELLSAIRTVAAGESLLSPAATQALIGHYLSQPESPQTPVDERLATLFELLTSREREIVAHVALGLTNDEIAQQLFVSPLTVKTHVNRSMIKLHARDRAQLVVLAFQTGLVQPGQVPTDRQIPPVL
jgi:DNA-binding NarL/FixJ family response regulator